MLPGLRLPLSVAFLDALTLALTAEVCPDCKDRSGLCAAHRWEVLPQLARPLWVRLMGTVSIEQTELQEPEPEPLPDPTPQALRAMRRNVRKARRLAELAAKLAA